jgi:D-methionine transport system substrate-binding protein
MNRGTISVFALSVVAALGATGASAQAVLRVGATPVPHVQILEQVKDELAAKGVKLEIVELSDYVTPNLALADGQLDANFFQHLPYLESFSADRKLSLESVAAIHVEPLGLYSKKYRSVDALPKKALIALPNDPTNEGRALIFLQAKGLIKLAPNAGLKATPRDIVENKKNFKFKELEAAQLPRTLQDVSAAVINGNFALQAGFNPVRDSLILEGGESPYANILVVRKGESKDPRIVALAQALTSQKVKDFILKTYDGGVVPAF